MAFPIHAIGEQLVAEMIRALGNKFWSLCRRPGSSKGELEAEGGPDLEILVPAPLEPYADYAFDGMSAVDICLKSKDIIVGCEVKLGLHGLGPTSLVKTLLACELSEHKNPRWNGSVMAILSRHFKPECSGDLKVNWNKTPKTLSKNWVFIARERVLSRLEADANFIPPTGMHLVSFEELAREVGKETFNKIASDAIPADPFQKWVEDQRTN